MQGARPVARPAARPAAKETRRTAADGALQIWQPVQGRALHAVAGVEPKAGPLIPGLRLQFRPRAGAKGPQSGNRSLKPELQRGMERGQRTMEVPGRVDDLRRGLRGRSRQRRAPAASPPGREGDIAMRVHRLRQRKQLRFPPLAQGRPPRLRVYRRQRPGEQRQEPCRAVRARNWRLRSLREDPVEAPTTGEAAAMLELPTKDPGGCLETRRRPR
mmetsp:Transcript_57236/g.123839  ORF Transcript_57236/g.123839 Transcript_57236/m.123839 type:complete len:216 (+) Transcript_57236:974-1621(+)